MRTILFFLASGLVWGLLEIAFGFTIKDELIRLVKLARRGGI